MALLLGMVSSSNAHAQVSLTYSYATLICLPLLCTSTVIFPLGLIIILCHFLFLMICPCLLVHLLPLLLQPSTQGASGI
ncbi:hypothetical protein BDF14DRAFT_1868703 [Spinellus fusiger]|nr:hypothetical protein BDF14DRAFT_1868703 [Spinellus fusiger]